MNFIKIKTNHKLKNFLKIILKIKNLRLAVLNME